MAVQPTGLWGWPGAPNLICNTLLEVGSQSSSLPTGTLMHEHSDSDTDTIPGEPTHPVAAEPADTSAVAAAADTVAAEPADASAVAAAADTFAAEPAAIAARHPREATLTIDLDTVANGLGEEACLLKADKLLLDDTLD